MGYTNKAWSETKAELRECFRMWGVLHWDIECETTQYSRGGLPDEQRAVLVWYVHPETGEEKRLQTSLHSRPMDNLRAIYLTLDSIRLAEKRGLGELMKQNYAALPAPKQRSPWEVLGLQPGADAATIEAVWKAKVRTAHPDTGGSNEAFKELREAYEAVRNV